VPATVSVPLNTMLADLDAALRRLLEAELADHGFDGVRVSFEAPTNTWAAGLTAPTVDLFLYDLREAADLPVGSWTEKRGNGPARLERPALRLECSYAVTAWTRDPEDEHRLLSQTLAVLLAHTRLPDPVLGERLAEASAAQGPIMGRIGQPKGDKKAEFWTAIGGRYRVSLDYVVTLSIVPGVSLERGPEVRTHTVRVADRRAGRRPPFERHQCGGIVRWADGQPVADAWVVLSDLGAWASSGRDGRFTFTGVPAGRHRCECRVPGGVVAAAELVVPGGRLELTAETP
jgi:hypothetical protein